MIEPTPIVEELHDIGMEVSEEKEEEEESLIQGYLVERKESGEEGIQKFQFENSGEFGNRNRFKLTDKDKRTKLTWKQKKTSNGLKNNLQGWSKSQWSISLSKLSLKIINLSQN
jgi:hypothetical protein